MLTNLYGLWENAYLFTCSEFWKAVKFIMVSVYFIEPKHDTIIHL